MLPGIGIFCSGSQSFTLVKVLVPLIREKGFRVEAIWSKTAKESEEIAKLLQISFHTNKIDDVLLKKDVDMVFIICPPYLHAEISVKALGIGKHVVCDNMGLNQQDALKMVRASQYYPALISLVNHSLRFLPAFIHMKRALQDEVIGTVSLIDVRIQMGSLFSNKYDWMCDSSMGGGALHLIGSHVIDLITFLIGKKAIRTHGILRTYTKQTPAVNGIRQISAPDFCTFQLELEGGILVTASIHSHVVPTSTFTQEIMVCGSEGHLVVRGGDLFLWKHQFEKPVKEEAIYVDVQDLHAASTMDSWLPKPYIKGLCKMIGALKEAFGQKESSWVKEPVQSAATFEDGLYVQAVIESIKASSESRTWKKVEINNESPTHEKNIRFTRMTSM